MKVLSCSVCADKHFYSSSKSECLSCKEAKLAENCYMQSNGTLYYYSCINGTEPVYDTSLDYTLIAGCKSCTEYDPYCSQCNGYCTYCNDGYYLSSLTGSYVCLKCPDKNCASCN